MQRKSPFIQFFFGMLLTAIGVPLYCHSKTEREGPGNQNVLFAGPIDRNIFFLHTFSEPESSINANPLPTAPVNCYGKDSCIQAAAYADLISIRVDATQNNVLTPPMYGGVFFIDEPKYYRTRNVGTVKKFAIRVSRFTRQLHHFLDQPSQHHQSIIHIFVPGFAKTDTDEMMSNYSWQKISFPAQWRFYVSLLLFAV